MTTPNKLFPSQKGFPTPDAPPDVTGCRGFTIPSDEAYFALFMGALDALRNPWNWYINGALSQQEAADIFAGILDAAYENAGVAECFPDVETPFWDDGTDVDVTATREDQPWYGELEEVAALAFVALADEPTLDWFENLAIWALAGFIAYSGMPLAAIAFIPFSRKFVLTFKKGSAGAIVNVIFDGLHLAGIDTYGVEDEIINVLIDVGLEPSGQELWIEHSGEHNPDATPNADGDYVIQVVKRKLDTEPLAPPDARYDSTCDCVQTTWDGGTTWVDNPGADPRTSPVYARPVVSGARCEAAGGMVELTRRTVNSIVADADVLTIANVFLDILFVLSGGAGILIDLIIVVVEGLIALGALAIQAAFDDAAYGRLLCDFFCNIGTSGEVSPSALAAIETAIESDTDATVSDVMQLLLSLWGNVGLQNAGVAFADDSVDCSGCICCEAALGGNGENGWYPSTDSYLVMDCVTDYDAAGDRFVCTTPCNTAYIFCVASLDILTMSSISCHLVGTVTTTTPAYVWSVWLGDTQIHSEQVNVSTVDADFSFTPGSSPGAGVLSIRAYWADRFGDPISSGEMAITAITYCP